MGEHPIDIATRGFNVWAAKEHNRKWFKKIDGTPIPNDLPLCIAMEFVEALKTAELPSATDAVRGALEEAEQSADKMCERYLRLIGRATKMESALSNARKALIKSGFVGPGDHGDGDPEINEIDAALAQSPVQTTQERK